MADSEIAGETLKRAYLSRDERQDGRRLDNQRAVRLDGSLNHRRDDQVDSGQAWR